MEQNKAHGKTPTFKVAQGVYVGVLMSPAEVAHATQGRNGELYEGVKRWTLCGDVSPGVFDLLQVDQVLARARERLTSLTSASGLNYLVFTHQVGAFQHRYLAPMFDRKVSECLQEIAHGGSLGFSLAGESEQAFVWRSKFQGRDFMPLIPLCGEVPDGKEDDALEEYGNVLLEAQDPARIATLLAGTKVRYTSVSAIPPQDLVAQYALRHGVRA